MQFQSYSMKQILKCLSNRLLVENYLTVSDELKSRYTSYPSIYAITSNTGQLIPDKYIQRINDKTVKFLYPSEDPSKCESVFKVTLNTGNYKLECIGASGGKGRSNEGGFGGYSCGVLSLPQKSDLF